MREMRHRVDKELYLGHTTSNWKNQDANPDIFTSKANAL